MTPEEQRYKALELCRDVYGMFCMGHNLTTLNADEFDRRLRAIFEED